MKRTKKQPIFHKLLLLYAAFLISIGCLVFVIIQVQFYRTFNAHVEISEFTICEGLDQISNRPINPGFEFSQNVDHLYACGKLQSNIHPDLLFYWFSEEDDEVIYHNIDNVRYVSGYFSSELRLIEPLKPGKYRVDVYKARQVIASARFEIRSR